MLLGGGVPLRRRRLERGLRVLARPHLGAHAVDGQGIVLQPGMIMSITASWRHC